MAKLVQDDGVALSYEGGDGAHGGAIAIGEEAGVVGFFKVGDLLFELAVIAEGSADEPGSGGSGAVLVGGFDGGFFEGWMLGKAEVVVGGKVEEGSSFEADQAGEGVGFPSLKGAKEIGFLEGV